MTVEDFCYESSGRASDCTSLVETKHIKVFADRNSPQNQSSVVLTAGRTGLDPRNDHNLLINPTVPERQEPPLQLTSENHTPLASHTHTHRAQASWKNALASGARK